jgi:hypothetical protein
MLRQPWLSEGTGLVWPSEPLGIPKRWVYIVEIWSSEWNSLAKAVIVFSWPSLVLIKGKDKYELRRPRMTENTDVG